MGDSMMGGMVERKFVAEEIEQQALKFDGSGESSVEHGSFAQSSRHSPCGDSRIEFEQNFSSTPELRTKVGC